ncbi:hypothetical protein HDU96_009657 [Phlyctochytrium bullatum]|nr:hypothetical protein HDU96_009657 [Phlyctochytrium bullatum]
MLLALPDDVLFSVQSFLTVRAGMRVVQACRHLSGKLKQPYPVARLLLGVYGKPLVMYRAFTECTMLLTGEVAKCLYGMGAGLPRFLVQLILKEAQTSGAQRTHPVIPSVSPGLYAFVVQLGYEKYGDMVDFFGNDQVLFKRLVSGSSEDALDPEIRSLICDYGFIPTQSLRISEVSDQATYAVSKMDSELFDVMLRQNGLQITSEVDAGVMRRVLSTPFSVETLQFYLERGFSLHPQVVKVGLRRCDANSLSALRHFIDTQSLQHLALEVLQEAFGREFDFSAILVNFLIRQFEFKEDDVGQALLIRDEAYQPQSMGPRTNCYYQANPGQAWRWILRTYGPVHWFTRSCFFDSVLRVSSNDSSCLDFIAAGVPISPDFLPAVMRACESDKSNQALLLEQLREHFSSQILGSASTMISFERTIWTNVFAEWMRQEEEEEKATPRVGKLKMLAPPRTPRQLWVDEMRRLHGVLEVRNRKGKSCK